ncbi:7 transmembrane sweet-taste receptor of 3 GCPR [Nitzschia inconspicua]|uniref:7 transmembrane sweet-taste receptor of 3 GCPR n=1 Tax=Nitzschia inconspicua TaxID=303405 RepID=A0A9K3LJY8_9STRA|nr:7 transmembrane sweet-taste receptor of 3 GCPR [Nitzschia inconspicua]KAG7362371.1 7 transmembrane sweet-taste receptor of 3 GCPR [Nitzschia inconspicua]
MTSFDYLSDLLLSPSLALPSFESINVTHHGVLNSLPVIDSLLADYHLNYPENVRRRSQSIVDIVNLRVSEDSLGEESNGIDSLYLPHCHVVGMLPFTPFRNVSYANLETYEEAVAMILALQHLNTANGSIIDELEGLQCSNMAFTLEFLDTHFMPGPAIEKIFELNSRSSRSQNEGLRPCSFVGAVRSAVTLPTSLVTGHRGFVQVSGSSTSFQLDERDQYPLFARTIPSDMNNVKPILEYFRDRLQLTHLAVLTMNEAYGQSIGHSIQVQASELAPNLRISRITMDEGTRDGIARALQEFEGTKYRYVLAAVSTPEIYRELLQQAVDLDLAGNGEHQWFFPESFYGSVEKNSFLPTDSKLVRAYKGVGIFSPTYDDKRSDNYNNPNTININSPDDYDRNRHDKLLEQMNNIRQSPDDIAYINRILPNWEVDSEEEDTESANLEEVGLATEAVQDPKNSLVGGVDILTTDAPSMTFLGPFGSRFSNLFPQTYPFVNDPEFLNPVVHDSVAYIYDATILMGLSACQAIQQNNGEAFNGQEQFGYLTQTNFQGVTGEVVLDATTGSRIFNSTTYKLVNLVEELVSNIDGQAMIRFSGEVTDVYQGSMWDSRRPFIFNDGTTTAPDSLPPPDRNSNRILPGVRGLAWTLSFINMFMAVGFVCWTYRNRNTRVVKASQPFFLYLLCSGVVLVASSTIPFSYDRQFSSRQACTRACLATVWLLFVGVSVVFSSLFSKAYRINLIMRNATKFRRVTITVSQTLKPMAILLFLNVIILTVMTVLNPPQYRVVAVANSNDSFGRPREYYGQCAYQEQAWYFLALALLNGSILILSVIQSWNARGLATEFSESKYIFLALTVTMIVVFVGAPVLVMARDTPNAILFLGSAINFVFCTNVILLMFVPKILYRQNENGTKRTKISGLEEPPRKSVFGKNQWTKTKNNTSEEGSPDSMVRLSHPTSSQETQDSGGNGERILTTKSAKELAKLVNRLQRLLDKKDAEIRMLKHQQDETLPTTPEQLRQNAQKLTDELPTTENEMEKMENQHQVEQIPAQMSPELDEENPVLGSPHDYEEGNVIQPETQPPIIEELQAKSDDVSALDVSTSSFPPSSSSQELALHGIFYVPSGIPMAGSSIVDLVNIHTSEEDSLEEDGNSDAIDPLHLPHCHVVGMLPFTPFRNVSYANLETYEEAVAMILALQHLNTGNGSIIDELDGLQCSNMVFTLEFLDTLLLPGLTIDDVFELTVSSRSARGQNEGLRPCSFLGAVRSAVTL